MKKDTIVISAFPACGKSYAFNNFQEDDFILIDSDSSHYSWIKDADGNNTKERNPEFPANYIKHIQDNIGKVDVIFISSHLNVRKALKDANIKFATVFPGIEFKDEWIRRFKERGNDEAFIKFQSDNWDKFINELIEGDDTGFRKIILSENEYISKDLLKRFFTLKLFYSDNIYKY